MISWQDQSSNAYVLSQDTILERPTLLSSGLNDLPSLEFYGAQFLNGGDILDIYTNSRSMFCVGAMTEPSGDSFFTKSESAAVPDRYGILRPGNGHTRFQYVDLANHDINTGFFAGPNDNALYFASSDRSSAENKFFINNTLIGSSIFNALYSINSDQRFLIGALSEVGDATERHYLDGTLSEILFVDMVDSCYNFCR